MDGTEIFWCFFASYCSFFNFFCYFFLSSLIIFWVSRTNFLEMPISSSDSSISYSSSDEIPEFGSSGFYIKGRTFEKSNCFISLASIIFGLKTEFYPTISSKTVSFTSLNTLILSSSSVFFTYSSFIYILNMNFLIHSSFLTRLVLNSSMEIRSIWTSLPFLWFIGLKKGLTLLIFGAV